MFKHTLIRSFSTQSSSPIIFSNSHFSSSSSLPTKTEILSNYRKLLKSVKKIALGKQQLYAQERNEAITPNTTFNTINNNKFYKYNKKWVDYVVSSYKANKALTNPKEISLLHQNAVDSFNLYDGNLAHSLYLFESGWGIHQEGKNQVRNVARRVGLEVTKEGEKKIIGKHTSLAGTAGEKYKIGKGVKTETIIPIDNSNQTAESSTKSFDLNELEKLKRK